MSYRIKINQIWFELFDNLVIDRNLDSLASSFSFDAKYDVNFKSIFKPLSYNNIDIYKDNVIILSGVIVNHSFASDSSVNIIGVSGYSKSGILEDVTLPISLYPLESINKSLNDIVKKIFGYFDIKYVVDSSVQKEMNMNFSKSVATNSETIKDYISKLANQRNILISHRTDGSVVFFRPNSKGDSKAYIGKESGLKMTLSVNGQNMFYTNSIQRQPKLPKGRKKTNGAKKPLLNFVDSNVNILVADKKRETSNIMSSGDSVDTNLAVNNFLADQYKNIQLDIDVKDDTFLNVGDLVDVQNEEVYLSKKSKWMVCKITQNITSESVTSSISLNIPETFSGEKLTENIFDL